MRLTPWPTLGEHRMHLEDDRKVHEETQRVGTEISGKVTAVHEAVVALAETVGELKPVVDTVAEERIRAKIEREVKNKIRARWGSIGTLAGGVATVGGFALAFWIWWTPASKGDVVVAGPGSATQSPAPLKGVAVAPPKRGATH
jgi:hypothetical protein